MVASRMKSDRELQTVEPTTEKVRRHQKDPIRYTPVGLTLLLPRDAMLAGYMLSSCVRPSGCLSQAGNVPKQINAGSRKQRRTIAHGF